VLRYLRVLVQSEQVRAQYLRVRVQNQRARGPYLRAVVQNPQVRAPYLRALVQNPQVRAQYLRALVQNLQVRAPYMRVRVACSCVVAADAQVRGPYRRVLGPSPSRSSHELGDDDDRRRVQRPESRWIRQNLRYSTYPGSRDEVSCPMFRSFPCWAAFAVALSGCQGATRASGSMNDAATDAFVLPAGATLEVVDGMVVTIGPDGETSTASALPSCHWPVGLDPPDAGPGTDATAGWIVTRMFLFCGSRSCEGEGCDFGGSDSLTALLGPAGSPSPCVLGCAPDHYLFGIENTGDFPPGETLLPPPATPAGCTSLFPYAQAGVEQTDGPDSQNVYYCCPCE